MTIQHNAYLIGFINKLTGQLERAFIYSESNPTAITDKYFLVQLMKGTGNSFKDAIAHIKRQMDNDYNWCGGIGHYRWLKKYMDMQTRNDIEDCKQYSWFS